ncbi:MAG: hypothetical protein EOO77_22555 [Oxalobacteraceae bacterium]|nr:MAG: hypothetical protein EOO77_22555 [Oxalobacteraceae bacterium]
MRAEVEANHLTRNWYATESFAEWTERANHLLGRIIDEDFAPLTAASLMRYAVYILHLPFSMNKMDNFQKFAEKYRNIVMADDAACEAAFKKMFPHAVPAEVHKKPEPLTYGPLVRMIRLLKERRPEATEDEVIALLGEDGSEFNEATARGLYRRSMRLLDHEQRVLDSDGR